jgi:uncharacterized protein YbjT (DUF2867 family)
MSNPRKRSAAIRTAVVAGASGLVGRELVGRLLLRTEYKSVVALTRRPLRLDRRLREVPASFERLDETLGPVIAADARVDAFCCLGTTIRTAGSEAAFRRVDHDYVLSFARWAIRRGAVRLIVVSALGADARSRVFYNRVKGEVEGALRELAGTSLVIVRPSLLDGRRDEARLGEMLALFLSRPLRRLLPVAIRPITVADVAQTMIDAALADQPAAIIESATMQGAAARAVARSAL